MSGGSRLDTFPTLPLKLLAIYYLKVRYLVPLIQKRLRLFGDVLIFGVSIFSKKNREESL